MTIPTAVATHGHETEQDERKLTRHQRRMFLRQFVAIRRPRLGQPATSQCPRCGKAWGALTARVAIAARKQHEEEAHA